MLLRQHAPSGNKRQRDGLQHAVRRRPHPDLRRQLAAQRVQQHIPRASGPQALDRQLHVPGLLHGPVGGAAHPGRVQHVGLVHDPGALRVNLQRPRLAVRRRRVRARMLLRQRRRHGAERRQGRTCSRRRLCHALCGRPDRDLWRELAHRYLDGFELIGFATAYLEPVNTWCLGPLFFLLSSCERVFFVHLGPLENACICIFNFMSYHSVMSRLGISERLLPSSYKPKRKKGACSLGQTQVDQSSFLQTYCRNLDTRI